MQPPSDQDDRGRGRRAGRGPVGDRRVGRAGARRQRGRRGAAGQHLAGRRGAHRRPGRAAPLDHRVRQLAGGSPSGSPAGSTRSPPSGCTACRGRAAGPHAPRRVRGGQAGRAVVRARPGAAPRRAVAAPARPSTPRAPSRSPAPTTARCRARQRSEIEEALKAGRLPGGGRHQQPRARHRHGRGRPRRAGRVAAQRRRPACSGSGAPATRSARSAAGVILPKYRGDLVQCAVVAERMVDGGIEATALPAQPARRARPAGRRDVRARVVARSTTWPPWCGGARRSRRCPQSALEATLDMLSGRYPSDDFAELRPRITWDRVTGVLAGRPGRAAARRHQRRHHPRPRHVRRVPRRREGQPASASSTRRWSTSRGSATCSCSGSSAWRIEDITHDRVLVTPAPGQPGRMPFWTGDAPGRPVELGRALGAFLREVDAPCRPRTARARLRDGGPRRRTPPTTCSPTSPSSARPPGGCPTTGRSWSSGSATSSATGAWRSTPRSARRSTQPWALALGRPAARAATASTCSRCTPTTASCCGCPRPEEAPGAARSPSFEPGRASSRPCRPRWAARRCSPPGSASAPPARCCSPAATRAGAPRCGSSGSAARSCCRSPAQYGSFPVVLETMRECCRTSSTCPGLTQLMRDVEARKVRLVEVETAQPVAVRPVAAVRLHRRVHVRGRRPAGRAAGRRPCRSTRALLAELLGQAELRELIDADALAEVEAEVQRLDRGAPGQGRRDDRRPAAPARRPHDGRGRRARRHAGVAGRAGGGAPGDPGADRRRGALGRDRGRRPAAGRPRRGAAGRRARGVHRAGPRPARRPRRRATPARTGRSTRPTSPAGFGLGVAVVDAALARLSASGRVVHGEFRPGGTGLEWCDAEVLRMLRRRSLAKLRKEVEPVPPEALARFLPQWQGLGAQAGRGVDGLLRVVEQLQGARRAGLARWSRSCCPSRVRRLLPGDARRADRVRRGALGRRRLAARQRRLGRRCRPRTPPTSLLAPVARRQPHARCTTPSSRRSTAGRRCSSGRCPTGSARSTTAPWSARCGTSSGPAGSPTTRSARCAPCSAAGSTTHGDDQGPGAPARPLRPAGDAAAAAGRRPPPAAGRCCPSATPTRPAAPTRWPRRCWTGTASSPAARCMAERAPGGFAAVYPVLKAFEEAGRVRRGYFVEGLGAAQFAAPGAVDRMRALAAVRPVEEEMPWQTPGPGRLGLLRLGRPPAQAPRRRARPRAGRHRPGQPVRRRAALAAAGQRPPARAARPARWSCSSTASWCSTSSAAARRC